ncbi:MAG: peptidase E [Candidatus Magasanikbacteria bacterium CG_4_10_14_0_2_um_filter_41_10]|uniref:Peptidase E n=1 Tax=Candidatus Magasanikbacteria bacterium CG_4_10_14_0_2_um_filter_41_10 TaxID=1974638 RepID=A0A2M7V3P4_9BACT|nr:MAG: peptidase E [Candidatus Magasanikbacteria bacterium CG_4_10_14_0_2_um_filter_41_10]
MKLLLTSSGFTNKTIVNAFRELLGKPFSETELVFIPTAANVESGDKGWLIDDMNNAKKLGLKSIDVVDISALPKEIWESRIEKADVIMVSGGNSYHLVYWMNKSGFIDVLNEWLKTKVYVGISAGSMVMSKDLSLATAQKIYHEDLNQIDIEKGLGFVDFITRPHLNSEWFPSAREDVLKQQAKKIPGPIYAIDDNSAIQVVDGEIELISEGKWLKFN